MVPCFVMLSGYRSVLTIGRTTGTDRSGGINGVIAPEPLSQMTLLPRSLVGRTLFCALLGSTVRCVTTVLLVEQECKYLHVSTVDRMYTVWTETCFHYVHSRTQNELHN